MDKVVHFEIPAEDLNRAQTFYAGVFGWETNSVPGMNYVMVRSVPVDEHQMPREPGAINGGMLQRHGPITAPIVTIQVPDIDEAAQKIREAGGDLVREKLAVGHFGFAAYFKDSEGNVLGLWQTTG
jgi:predicted enzyme related to lactoylglutathione lyase